VAGAGLILPHRWPGPPLAALLIDRPNRFLALCKLGRRTVEAHVPDRGRALDILQPGQPLILVEAAAPERRTRFTVLLGRARTAPSPWVCLDPAGAPRLVEAALARGLLPSLAGLRVARREVAHGRSRIDLLLAGPAGEMLCEVKSVGAIRGGVALFPDAPTERGARHLAELASLARRGQGAAVVFVAQREDAVAVAADREIDPDFAAALVRARRAGVRVAALGCTAQPEGMLLRGEIPVAGAPVAR
jgi:sugar fermentation stimulation protein A